MLTLLKRCSWLLYSPINVSVISFGHANVAFLEQLVVNSIFKGILKQHINKRRKKKQNRRKSNERKRKRTENNVQRVYGICVGNPLGNALCTLLEQPSWKSVLKLRMLQEAESPPTLSRKPEIMFTPSCTLKSTLWRKALLLLAALVKETPIAAQATTKNSTTAKMKKSASESCIRK